MTSDLASRGSFSLFLGVTDEFHHHCGVRIELNLLLIPANTKKKKLA